MKIIVITWPVSEYGRMIRGAIQLALITLRVFFLSVATKRIAPLETITVWTKWEGFIEGCIADQFHSANSPNPLWSTRKWPTEQTPRSLWHQRWRIQEKKKKENAKGAHATRGAGGRLPPFPFCSCKVHELFVQPNGNVNYDRGAASKIYTLTQNSRSAMYYLLRDCILEYEPRRK